MSIVEFSKSFIVGYNNGAAVEYALLPDIRYAGSVTDQDLMELIIWDHIVEFDNEKHIYMYERGSKKVVEVTMIETVFETIFKTQNNCSDAYCLSCPTNINLCTKCKSDQFFLDQTICR